MARARLFLGRALEQLGHVVAFAENGRQALEALRQRLVDLVPLDIEMPEMDGYQVLEALAADPHVRDIPVVIDVVGGGSQFKTRSQAVAVYSVPPGQRP